MSTVLDLVREFREGGGFYDDEALQFVSERLGVEPSRDLSRACYEAKGLLSDEAAQTKLDAYIADGFVRFADADVQAGKKYAVRRGVTYVGRSVPDYSGPITCRAIYGAHGMVAFLPGRNRTHGYYPNANDLVRPT